MTVRFIVNGEDMELNTAPEQRLVTLLREHSSFRSCRQGCLGGKCGVCAVIFNGVVALSCQIFAFRLPGSEVITLEGFSQTIEYRDITRGLADAGVERCDFCRAGTILAAELLLEHNTQPSKEAFTAAFRGIHCRCAEPESLYRGILAAGYARQRRIYGRF